MSSLALSGCSGVNAKHDEDATQQVLKLATFDMNCPKEKLQTEVLDKWCKFGECIPNDIGVTGCDKQARYTRVAGTERWVTNTASKK